ncbi:MAG: hypothetical protein AAF849_01050 [Bacteroidota bacterium]
MESHIAGSPTDLEVKWACLKLKDIALHIKQNYQVDISNVCVKRILKADGYVRRKPIKSLATGRSKHRSEPFKIIISLVALFHQMDNNPTLSVDKKRTEQPPTDTEQPPNKT